MEYVGLLGHINQVLYNRDLAIFYAYCDIKLTEALDLAQKECEVMHDVYRWDALSWVYYKNGKLDEAAKASQSALRFGTRDALLMYYADWIAERTGQHDVAQRELHKRFKNNPHFYLLCAEPTQKQLAILSSKVIPNENADGHVG